MLLHWVAMVTIVMHIEGSAAVEGWNVSEFDYHKLKISHRSSEKVIIRFVVYLVTRRSAGVSHQLFNTSVSIIGILMCMSQTLLHCQCCNKVLKFVGQYYFNEML